MRSTLKPPILKQVWKGLQVLEHADHDDKSHGNWARGIRHGPKRVRKKKTSTKTKKKAPAKPKEKPTPKAKKREWEKQSGTLPDGTSGIIIAEVDGVRIIGAHNNNEELANQHVDRFQEAVKGITPEHYQNMTVNFMHESDFPMGSMAYIAAGDQIWIFDQGLQKDAAGFRSALTHEIGHRQHVEQNPGGFRRFKKAGHGSTSDFKKITSHWTPGSQKNYKKGRHAGETFAEAYSQFHVAPEKLKANFPEIYDFMEKEYG
jgi:hypothetical protein